MPRTERGIDLRLVAALGASRIVATGIRRLGRGGGTSAPGLVAERLDPGLLTKLTCRLPDGVVVVAGTNGKTTTSRMVADIFAASGRRVVHNRSGSNLVRGVFSAFAGQAGITGDPRAEIGVVETDEAALPDVIRLMRPQLILLNNLFRDQLDRYGELDTISRTWQKSLEQLDGSTTIVVNGDDPTLVAITDKLPARRIVFGLNEHHHRLDALPHAADAATCRACGADLAYRALYVSHLGDWYCPTCGNARPTLDVSGSAIDLVGVESLSLDVTTDRTTRFEIGVPGFYNAYNALAAIAVADQFDVPVDVIRNALIAFRSAFGRIERVDYRGRKLTFALVKNPTGFNEVLRMLTLGDGGLIVPTLIAINDFDADGRDVSWLWDVDFELLSPGSSAVGTSGIRGADMANRLLYAGVERGRIQSLPDDLPSALDTFVESVPDGGTAYVLPTYTAMLALRKYLADQGAVPAFWQQ